MLLLCSGAASASSEHGLPTQLRPDQLRTQWVTDLDYDGPEGHFGMNLVFRVAEPTRFSVLAKDKLGRSWWALAVDGQEALALDLRHGTHCAYAGAVQIEAVPLGPLDFHLIPQFILGHLPVEPTRAYFRADGEWSLQDDRERTWFARLDEQGELRSWRLMSNGGAPRLWWSRGDRVQVFSAPEQELQLRWKNSKPRQLQGDPRELDVPEDSKLDCESSSFFAP